MTYMAHPGDMIYADVMAEARSLKGRGFASVGISISQGPRGKSIRFKSGWQKATVDDHMDFLDKADNGLALNTGDQSDLIVLDVDLAKPDDLAQGRLDGHALMESLLQLHGLDPDTPVQVTGSGGMHLLFGLSESLRLGLHSSKNAAKVRYEGQETTIDVRGDGGCIVVYPSSYQGADGTMKTYRWQTAPTLAEKLKPMPPWLITILNNGLKRKTAQESHLTSPASEPLPMDDPLAADGAYYAMTGELVRKEAGGITKTWTRRGGFDFEPSDRSIPCNLCGRVHDSNNYFVRRIISTCCTLKNYSPSCCTKVLGEEDVEALTNLAMAPCLDDRIIDILRLVIRDQGHDLVYTGQQWLLFQGLIWEAISDMEVKRRLKLDVNYAVIQLLIKCLASRKKKRDLVENQKTMLDNLRKTFAYLMKSGNVTSVAESGKILRLDESISSKLDTNKDIIAAANGVIDLKTGVLREATTEDYLSRFIDTKYRGLEHPTPFVDAFFHADRPAVWVC